MSANNRINLKHDRRQWLQASAAVLGAAVLPLHAAAEPQVTPTTPTPKPEAAPQPKSPTHFFTPDQHALIEELSETIIPADSHSGGAKAAKVADFIEQTVRETSDDAQKSLWREGLRLIDLMSKHYNGKSFVESSFDEKTAVLKVLSDNIHMDELTEVQFFRDLKHLTVRGYYTSRIGVHDELEYKGNRILQEFVGCDDPTPSS